MTYGDLYSKALYKLCLAWDEVEDYRPAVPMFIDELKQPIDNAIVIWLKTGEKIIYIDKERKGNETN